MKRRGPRTEFALWVKHLTGQAIRLSVPLGFLESQETLVVEDFDELMKRNRTRYCGTLADIPTHSPMLNSVPEPSAPAAAAGPTEPKRAPLASPQPAREPEPVRALEPDTAKNSVPSQAQEQRAFGARHAGPVKDRELGKGGA